MSEQLLAWVFRILVLVWKMRQHQKAFFKEHKREDLIESKAHENEVDKELMQHLKFENGVPVALMVTVQEDEPTQGKLL